jgi:oligopeptide/dipeptide ABC transporter ATP-binding protein
VTVADDVLLSVRNLTAGFDTEDGRVQAVDGVSFDIRRGEVFAIVGESGSGKSVTAMSILGLQPTLDVTDGEILWKGTDLLSLPEDEWRKIRGREIAMIFQDPLTALNPVHTVGRQVGEVARIHEGLNKEQAFERAIEMLDLVGIPEPRKRAKMYPHEFSGGMRQRAMIAMAISCKPDLLIADEPTTALDVTVQAQVLDVLLAIKDEINSAIALITHDLGVVAGLAHRVMVMYAGRQVELGTTDEVFYEHRHPYTLGLLASLPRLDSTGDEPLVPIVGTPPSLIHKPSGCAFHPRCRFGRVPGLCDSEVPALRLVAGDAHMAACHYAEDLEAASVETLREMVDVTADEEVADAELIEIVAAAHTPEEADLAIAAAAEERGITADGRPNDPESLVAGVPDDHAREELDEANEVFMTRQAREAAAARRGAALGPVDAPVQGPVGDAPADATREPDGTEAP